MLLGVLFEHGNAFSEGRFEAAIIRPNGLDWDKIQPKGSKWALLGSWAQNLGSGLKTLGPGPISLGLGTKFRDPGPKTLGLGAKLWGPGRRILGLGSNFGVSDPQPQFWADSGPVLG